MQEKFIQILAEQTDKDGNTKTVMLLSLPLTTLAGQPDGPILPPIKTAAGALVVTLGTYEIKNGEPAGTTYPFSLLFFHVSSPRCTMPAVK